MAEEAALSNRREPPWIVWRYRRAPLNGWGNGPSWKPGLIFFTKSTIPSNETLMLAAKLLCGARNYGYDVRCLLLFAGVDRSYSEFITLYQQRETQTNWLPFVWLLRNVRIWIVNATRKRFRRNLFVVEIVRFFSFMQRLSVKQLEAAIIAGITVESLFEINLNRPSKMWEIRMWGKALS